MKKLIYLIILLGLAISSFAQQNWREVMFDTTKNFYDIQAAFYEGCGDLPCDSAPGFKQFKRWEAHMAPRVYPTGIFDAETVFNEFLSVYYQDSQTECTCTNDESCQRIGINNRMGICMANK